MVEMGFKDDKSDARVPGLKLHARLTQSNSLPLIDQIPLRQNPVDLTLQIKYKQGNIREISD